MDMFKKVHLRLTLLCSVITIGILCMFAGLYLYIAERTLWENRYLSFQHDMDSLCTSLEQQTVITFQYLKTLEQNGNYLIYLWDNTVPFYFNNLEHHREYTALSQTALEKYQEMESYAKWDDTKSKHLDFQVRDEGGTYYDASGARILSGQLSGARILTAREEGAGLTLLVLFPRTRFNSQLASQRLWFLILAAAACLLLTFFAWFFTGRLLRPILDSQRRQIQFISDASHELRTPLSVIGSCISIRPPHYEDTIQQECIHMGRLINDMMVLTGLESGTQMLRKEPVEPDTVLLNLYEQLEPLAREKSLRMNITLPDDALPRCLADPGKLNQVMMILIQNAISYTPPGGLITLKAYSARKGVCFQVADTGNGISDEDKKNIFERFYRVQSSHSSKDHFGLGLCIAREIMQVHHGRLSVSDTPGGGSTFTCFFPHEKNGDASGVS